MASDPTHLAASWLKDFEALCAGKQDLLAVFVKADAYSWLRDLLVLGSDYRTYRGHEDIRTRLAAASGLHDFELEAAELTGGSVLVLFKFKITAAKNAEFIAPIDATGRGCARLNQQPDGQWRAWTVLLSLQDLVGHEEQVGRAKLANVEQTWDDAWKASCDAILDDLTVLVVGAGQSGLMTAARLKHMGIRTLVVERNKVGDIWNDRYSLLKLHTPIQTNSFPYQSWPETWPKYLPKTKIAQFMRSYAESQDLLVWESAELLSNPRPVYDEEKRVWIVHVRRGGETVTLRPRHIVAAVGFVCTPRIPDLPGRDRFCGIVLHSSQHKSAHAWKGKKVVVVGAGNSGCDIALDSLRSGASEVTLIQRSKATVMSIPALEKLQFDVTYPDVTHWTLEQLDLINNGIPVRAVLEDLRNGGFAKAQEMDRAMLDGLEAAGFKTDDTPLLEHLLRCACGFIEDQGAMQQIIEGRIKVKNGVQVARLEADSVVFNDGSTLPADVLVLATGYDGIRSAVRDIFGEELYKQTSEVWGLDEHDEVRGVYRPSGHKAFWYAVGFFAHARFLGRSLGLQILASELAREKAEADPTSAA